MATLPGFTHANSSTSYYALKSEVGAVSNWATFPAVATINASGYSITNASSLQIDDQVLTALSGELLLNGVPIATISGISNVSDWALYPAIGDVNLSNFAIQNASGITTTTLSATTISAGSISAATISAGSIAATSINVSGLPVVTTPSTADINLSGNAITNAASVQIGGRTLTTTNGGATPNLLINGSNILSNWSSFTAGSAVSMGLNDINNAKDIFASGSVNAGSMNTTTSITISAQVLTTTPTALFLNGTQVASTTPPGNVGDWATFPAVTNVNMSGFALTSGSSNGLDLSLGGKDVYIQTGGAGSCNCYIKGNVESGSITCKGVISQSNAGAGCNFFQSAVQVGVNGILPTDKLGQVIVYGVNTPAATSALFVQGGTTLDGGGTVHGITIGTQPVAGINTMRIDVLPVGIDIFSATFVTIDVAGAGNFFAGGALDYTAGSYITLQHGAGLGQNGIFVQNFSADSNTRMIFTHGGTLFNLTTLQASNIINPSGIQFWDGVYNPSGGAAPIAPAAYGRAVVDISSAGAYLANLTGGNIPTTPNSNSVFIGNFPNLTTGGASSTIAIGNISGMVGQSNFAIAIGSNAGQLYQDYDGIAIGTGAAFSAQGCNATAIGNDAGADTQGPDGIAIGRASGSLYQGVGAIAMGIHAGATNQGDSAIALGFNAGLSDQGVAAIAIGSNAGNISQGLESVAIGVGAGRLYQGGQSVAIGSGAGDVSQGFEAVAIGSEAGSNSQAPDAVAIGNGAGQNSQQAHAIAIGTVAGNIAQGSNSVAIGLNAGSNTQGSDAVAIGAYAGFNNLGANSVAIGYSATTSGGSFSNTIVLNATGAALNPSQANSCYIAPIQAIASLTPGYDLMGYNAATKEVVSAGGLSTLSLESVISNTQQITYDTGLLATTIAGITNLQTVLTSGPVTIGDFVTPADLVVSGTITLTDASGATKTQVVAQPSFVYYVSKNGRVGATGAITDPLSTINAALAKLASAGPVDPPGMTIYVATGSYTEDVVVPISLTLPAVSIIGMGDDADDSKRVQIRGSITINNTEASFANTVNTVVINNIAVFAKNASTSAVTITGRGVRVYLKNGLYTQQFASATASLISLASSVAPPSNATTQLVIDNCSMSMSSATASGHIVNVASGQIFSINNSALANRGTGSAINMAAGAFSGALNSTFGTLGAVMTIIQSAAGLTSLVGCTMSGRASPSVALITLGTNATLNLNDSIVQNLNTTEANNTSRYVYTTSATGNLIVAIRNNITNSASAALVQQITPFQAAVPAASQLLYFGNIYTNSTATLLGNLPAQGGANFNAVRQFNTDTYTQQLQVVATSASAIVLTPGLRGKTFILTGTTTQAFSTAGFGIADAGFFVIAHNGNASGGGDINMTGMSGTQIIHNRTATANGGDVYLYWNGAALVGY